MTEREGFQLLRARLSGVLEERRRLAREVHDTLLQGVVGIAVQLRALVPSAEREGTVTADQLKHVIALAEQTVHEARAAVWNLRSPPHARCEFSRRLELSVLERAGPDADVRVTVSGRQRELRAARRIAAIRIAQEAVTNAVRHGSAKRIGLHVEYRASYLRLTITDDGVGFVPGRLGATSLTGWGVYGMRERARALGGRVDIRSAPQAGTTVLLDLPYRRRERRNRGRSGVLSRRGE